MEPIYAFEREADRLLESLNGKSPNQILPVLPRIRSVIEKLDASLPLLPFDDDETMGRCVLKQTDDGFQVWQRILWARSRLL